MQGSQQIMEKNKNNPQILHNYVITLPFLAAIAALYLGLSLTHSLTDSLGPGAKLGQSYTTKGRPHIETWGLHKDIKDINDNDNNDGDDNNNNNENDNNNDKDNKGNSALGLDRSQGFSQGHQGYQKQQC